MDILAPRRRAIPVTGKPFSMVRLRDHLGLKSATQAWKWKVLRKSIEKTIVRHIDLFDDSPVRRREKRVESVAEIICHTFSYLFSDPDTGKTARLLLEEYVVSRTNELRRKGRATKRGKSRKRCRARKARIHLELESDGDSEAEDGRVVDYGATVRVYQEDCPREATAESLAVERYPLSSRDATPEPGQAPFTETSGSPQPQNSPEFIRSTVTPEPAHREDEELTPVLREPKAEYEEIHNFLASCKPRLTRLYPYLVAYGCVDMDYLQVMSEWSDKDLQAVLNNVKVVQDAEGDPVKPMDWDVLRHFIRKLK